jgi:flagella basal body P-ring formation protein FlgA
MTLVVPGEEGDQSFEIEPLISVAPRVAVATRSLAPGDNVQATDVKLVQVSTRQVEDPFYRLEDLIGQQAIGAIVEGQVFDRADVRAPLLVRRGDAVTVYARSAGVQVRTTARAQEEGSRGDLITVESMLNRQRFFARVTGIHEVEVFAHALEAPATAVSTAKALPNAKREAPADTAVKPASGRASSGRSAAPAEAFFDPQLKPAGYQAGINDRPLRRAQ